MLTNTLQKSIDVIDNLVQRTSNLKSKLISNTLSNNQYQDLNNRLEQLITSFRFEGFINLNANMQRPTDNTYINVSINDTTIYTEDNNGNILEFEGEIEQ